MFQFKAPEPVVDASSQLLEGIRKRGQATFLKEDKIQGWQE